MIESGIKTLKINAVKINKTLAEGNKSMKKLRAEEQTLFKIQKTKLKARKREEIVEGRREKRVGGMIRSKVINPGLSFIDKLKDFFLLLGAGILVNSLPAIIARINQFFEDNEGLINNIKFIVGEIGKLSMMFIELTQKLTPGKEKEIQTNLDELNKFLDGTNLSEIDASIKDLKDVDSQLKTTPQEPLGSLPVNPNPTPAAQAAPTPINSVSKKPVQVAGFNNAVKEVNKVISNSNYPKNKKVFLPGVGYISRIAGAFGSSTIKYETPEAVRMTKDEFLLQARFVEETIKGYSIGGTIKGSSYGTKNDLNLDTKPIVSSKIDSFGIFQKSTVEEANDLGEKTRSNNILDDLVENISKLFDLQNADDDDDGNSRPRNRNPLQLPRNRNQGGGPYQRPPTRSQQNARNRRAVTFLGRVGLPQLPATGTIRDDGMGQHYGDGRDDDGDGIIDRYHAGQDYDISGNEPFYSRIGGEVIYAGDSGGAGGYGTGYGNVVDIYNKDLNVTERIAEGKTILVKKGDMVSAGDPVVRGEDLRPDGKARTGVIHYEIRDGKAGPGASFQGTKDPVEFLIDQNNKYLQNLSVIPNIDRSVITTMQSPEDTSNSTTILLINRDNIIAT